MGLLTPNFLWLGLLALPLILLYMLRLRRRPLAVSSTLLWQRLARDREANAPWQRLRRNLLLMLQLAILAALALALSRPYWPVPALVSGNLVILLDGSASMRATDVPPSRFAAARDEVARLIDRLGGGDQMTLILADARPRVLAAATTDRSELDRALAEAVPGLGEADWAGAVALAAGAAQGFRDARVVVVSDGGLPADLPPLPAEVTYVPVGARDENVAIAALAAGESSGSDQLFVRVVNYGTGPARALLSLRLDDALHDSRRLDIPGSGEVSLTWALPADVSRASASLSDLEADFLAEDNVAWTVPGAAVRRRALLITPGNLFLEQVFSVLPGVAAFRTGPDNPLALDEPFDLFVFDGVAPSQPLPAGDLLLIDPPVSVPGLLEVGAVFTNTAVVAVAASPLLEYVDWGRVSVGQARSIVAPWASTLVAAEGGPLLLVGSPLGRRVAVIPFALRDSDLPLQVAFPILMANLADFLAPGQAAAVTGPIAPRAPVPLAPPAGSLAVLVTKPDGTAWRAPVGADPLVFAETDELGLYAIQVEDAAGARDAGAFAVNLFAPTESRLAPAPALPLGREGLAPAGGEEIGQWELWPWLAAAALGLLAVEWWVHHRGARLPRIPARR